MSTRGDVNLTFIQSRFTKFGSYAVLQFELMKEKSIFIGRGKLLHQESIDERSFHGKKSVAGAQPLIDPEKGIVGKFDMEDGKLPRGEWLHILTR